MQAILRKVVIPGELLSGLGNRAYDVFTEWLMPGGEVLPGTFPPKSFTEREAAVEHARAERDSWPYRAEAVFLNPDTDTYVPL